MAEMRSFPYYIILFHFKSFLSSEIHSGHLNGHGNGRTGHHEPSQVLAGSGGHSRILATCVVNGKATVQVWSLQLTRHSGWCTPCPEWSPVPSTLSGPFPEENQGETLRCESLWEFIIEGRSRHESLFMTIL